MTDNEIIKALEHNASKCRLYEDSERMGLYKSALDLINRLQNSNNALLRLADSKNAEIERFKNAYKQCAWERDTFQAEVDGLREHLSIPNGEEDEDWYTMPQLKTPEEIKAEAIKEFAERLKSKMIITHKSKEGYCVYEFDDELIDNLVKEMTENDFKE